MVVKGMWEKPVKRMSVFDWGSVKFAIIFFAFMVVALYPEMLSWLEWYWWFIFMVLLCAPLVEKALHGGNGNKQLIGKYRQAKEEFSLANWSMAKASVLFFGIGVADLYPGIVYWLDWYWWGLLWIVLMAIPIYFMYYYAPITEKHPTKFSKTRAKYTRKVTRKKK